MNNNIQNYLILYNHLIFNLLFIYYHYQSCLSSSLSRLTRATPYRDITVVVAVVATLLIT